VSSPLGEAEAAFLRDARVARLATAMPDGGLHVVPVCPVLDGDRIFIATELTSKVWNIRADPRVGVAFDDYDEDWSKLRGVSVSGNATVHEAGPVWERGRDLLYEKYPQYEPQAEIVPGRTLILEVSLDWISRGGL
jgi:nitroimidazol reductase NimA-like FMN-containing flavoprotein (pyridoxamine 5'-phosphate oxidase superfamily)